MRIIFFAGILCSMAVHGQVNRSANELAQENIQEYLTNILFKKNIYAPGTYSSLKSIKERDSNIAWFIVHQFEIRESRQKLNDSLAKQSYKFIFYLDKKLKVIKAESVQFESSD